MGTQNGQFKHFWASLFFHERPHYIPIITCRHLFTSRKRHESNVQCHRNHMEMMEVEYSNILLGVDIFRNSLQKHLCVLMCNF